MTICPVDTTSPTATPQTTPKAELADENTPVVPGEAQEVRLLQAVRIPAGHQKLVRGRFVAELNTGPLMFTPGELKGQLQMTDSVVECGGDQYMTLVIQNHGVEKMRLKKGRCHSCPWTY